MRGWKRFLIRNLKGKEDFENPYLRTVLLILLHRWLFIQAEVHLMNTVFLAENAISLYFEFLGEIRHGHNSATGWRNQALI